MIIAYCNPQRMEKMVVVQNQILNEKSMAQVRLYNSKVIDHYRHWMYYNTVQCLSVLSNEPAYKMVALTLLMKLMEGIYMETVILALKHVLCS